MKSNFLNWYTQALGATLGIIACIFAYLHGYMFTYNNISNSFDLLGFNGVISSYFLLPFCILTFVIGILNSYIPDKEILNMSIYNINEIIVVITLVIGFLGAKIYFIIPSIFILFSLRNSISNFTKIEFTKENDKNNNIEPNFSIDKTAIFFDENKIFEGEEIFNSEKSMKVLLTRKHIAKELLVKTSDKQFIMEITGFTLVELENLEKEFIKWNKK